MPPLSLAELKAYKPQIEKIAGHYGVANIRVFGSVARGDAVEGSDVDLLVDFTRPTFNDYFYFKEALAQLLHRTVDVVDASAIHNPLRRDYILRDAKVL